MTSPTEKGVCPHCGAKSVDYTFSFNTGLATFLGKLFDAGGTARTNDLNLTYSQRTNSQKLRYWALAVPYRNEEGRRKAGWWRITNRGKLFLIGLIQIPSKVVVCRNKIVAFTGPDILFSQVAAGYLCRQDYIYQARRQLTEQPGQLSML